MQLTINGQRRRVAPQPEQSLLQVLREQLGLLAAKPGCGEGACGACTVMLDGKPIRSCICPITDIDDGDVATLEGLLTSPATNVWAAVSDAFADIRAFQCGYCTPGMVVAAGALLHDNPKPTDAEIVAAMDGNVCRCGTYPRILRAVHQAADRLAGNEPGESKAQSARASKVAGWRQAGTSDAFASPPAKPWDLAEPGERDYFDRLGDGLVVILTPQEAERVNDGDAWSTEGGAWLHVGTDSRVTAFTGKVDVGQDNRTALELLVAEEMGLAPEWVELVMGDTDFCPADIGTFGSRSTQDAGGVLRAVAATACDWLRTRGADFPGGGERAVVYAQGDARTRDPKTWHVAGNRVEGAKADRRSARSIARGEARFASDTAVEGMLHGRVLRAPGIGAELRSANLDSAQAMDGVVAIRDEDFVGVTADSPVRAEAALAAVEAQWDVAPQPSEAELDEYLRAHPVEEEGWEGQFRHETGNVDRAIASAATSLSATYTTAYIAHVPLETRAAVARWDGDRLTVWTGTQRPFGVRADLAEALDVPEEKVRVIVPATGSGYGGKHSGEAAIEAARLARAAGKPVKVRWTRAEEFAWAYFRPAAVMDVRSGLDANGRLVAWDFANINSGPFGIWPPYEIRNQRLRYQPADSPLRQGSYRALAATANTFARESHIDELAAAAGIDPVAFRLSHLSDERGAAVLNAVADGIGWGSNERLGIAVSAEKGGYIATAAQVDVNPDGMARVIRIVTAFDCGAVVDPDNLRNQVEGATVMGLGGALFERIRFDNGRFTNGSMGVYRVPRFSDVPPIEVILIDRRDEPPSGAGETPIICVAPAIANAMFAATGNRLRSLPLQP